MSLSAKRSLQSTGRKFFMNLTYIMSRKKESNVFGLRGQNESNCQKLAPIDKKKIFHEFDVHHV